MKPYFLITIFLVFKLLDAQAQNIDELRPGTSSTESYMTQSGITANFYTKVRQMYANINTDPFKVGFYLSADTLITGADYLAATYSVACINIATPSCGATSAAGEIHKNCSVTGINLATLGVPPGTYYVGTFIDMENVIQEDNENDNTWLFRNANGVKTQVIISVAMSMTAYNLEKDIELGYSENGDYHVESKNGEDLIVEVNTIDGKRVLHAKGNHLILPKQNSEIRFIRISNAMGSIHKKIVQ